jgi:hypothetical protein
MDDEAEVCVDCDALPEGLSCRYHQGFEDGWNLAIESWSRIMQDIQASLA